MTRMRKPDIDIIRFEECDVVVASDNRSGYSSTSRAYTVPSGTSIDISGKDVVKVNEEEDEEKFFSMTSQFAVNAFTDALLESEKNSFGVTGSNFFHDLTVTWDGEAKKFTDLLHQ